MYYKNHRAFGQFFNRKLDRGYIKGKIFLEAIAKRIQSDPAGTIQHLKDNLVSFLRKIKAETITKEHVVFQELTPSKIGNKSADKIVEYIKACANKDPYMALAVMLLVSLYPIPSSTSREPDLLESVITKCLLGSRSFKESDTSQTDPFDQVMNLDHSEKGEGEMVAVELSGNKSEQIRRILGLKNVKEIFVVVVPFFSAIIVILSIVYVISRISRNIEFNPSDSHPDITVVSTRTTISSTITSSISTLTTIVDTTESSNSSISTSTANTDTTTDDLNASSLTSDITEPFQMMCSHDRRTESAHCTDQRWHSLRGLQDQNLLLHCIAEDL